MTDAGRPATASGSVPRPRAVARCLVVLFAVAVSAGGVVTAGARAQDAPVAWIFTRSALHRVEAHPGIRAGLGSATVYEVLNRGNAPLAGNTAIPVYHEFGHAQAIADVTGRRLPAGTRGILYDPEAWSRTPLVDQDNPVPGGQSAAAVAHAAGLLFLSAPGLSLERDNASCATAYYKCFLAQDLAGKFAAFSDVIDLQAQSLEMAGAAYLSFVRQAAGQAKAANPDVIVLAGLSTLPGGGGVPTVARLVEDVSGTRGLVSGYWLNIPDGNSALAVSLMKAEGA